MKLRIAVGAQRERAKPFGTRGVLLLKQRWASGSRTSEPRFHDKITLIYNRAAKLRRRKWAGDPRDYYEGYFGADHVQQHKKDLLIRLRREEMASALAALPDGSVVADVGWGVGDVLSELSPTWHRIGIDYSLRSLHLARQGSGEIAWVNGSLYDLPLGDSSANAVVCLEVLEHLERDSAALREIARAEAKWFVDCQRFRHALLSGLPFADGTLSALHTRDPRSTAK